MHSSLPTLICVTAAVLVAGCECHETVYRRMPVERAELELIGFDPAAPEDAPIEAVIGDLDYMLKIAPDGTIQGQLRTMFGALYTPDPDSVPPEGALERGIEIRFERSMLRAGEKRTLQTDDFEDVLVVAVIDGVVWRDHAPQRNLAFDLATGVMAGTIEGALQAEGEPDRPYAIKVDAVARIRCAYALDDPRLMTPIYEMAPAEGEVDVCATLQERVRAMPKVAATPAAPWDLDPPQSEMYCEPFG